MPLQVGSSKHKLESHVRCQGGGGGWRLPYNMVTVARLLMERSETVVGAGLSWALAARQLRPGQWWRTGCWPPLATTHWLEAPLHWTLPQIFINLRFGSTSIQHSDNNVFNVNRCYLFGNSSSSSSLVTQVIYEVLWCSGYHICFTRRRSPVRSWAGSQSFAQLCNCPAQSPSHQIIKYTRYT